MGTEASRGPAAGPARLQTLQGFYLTSPRSAPCGPMEVEVDTGMVVAVPIGRCRRSTADLRVGRDVPSSQAEEAYGQRAGPEDAVMCGSAGGTVADSRFRAERERQGPKVELLDTVGESVADAATLGSGLFAHIVGQRGQRGELSAPATNGTATAYQLAQADSGSERARANHDADRARRLRRCNDVAVEVRVVDETRPPGLMLGPTCIWTSQRTQQADRRIEDVPDGGAG